MRRAVLIAASRFEDTAFAPLQFPTRDAERLKEILADPALGGFDTVDLMANEPSRVARIALEKTARDCEPGDLLLFYFSGHGKLDRDGSLALAMPDSDTRVLGATSLVSDEIKRIFNLSRAAQKIMILDCCYSGAVGAEGFKGGMSDSIDSLAQQFHGSFLLTASQRFERAWENETKGGGALTEALIEGVRTGAAGMSSREHVTLSEIASYVKRSVPQDSPQQPEYWDNGGIGDLIFSKKPLSFDAEWARKARALVTRYVNTNIFDEELAESIRDVIRKRDDPSEADRLLLIERLARRDLQISSFIHLWPGRVPQEREAMPELRPAAPGQARRSAATGAGAPFATDRAWEIVNQPHAGLQPVSPDGPARESGYDRRGIWIILILLALGSVMVFLEFQAKKEPLFENAAENLQLENATDANVGIEVNLGMDANTTTGDPFADAVANAQSIPANQQ
jgi:uncharacterized caspase-like protein